MIATWSARRGNSTRHALIARPGAAKRARRVDTNTAHRNMAALLVLRVVSTRRWARLHAKIVNRGNTSQSVKAQLVATATIGALPATFTQGAMGPPQVRAAHVRQAHSNFLQRQATRRAKIVPAAHSRARRGRPPAPHARTANSRTSLARRHVSRAATIAPPVGSTARAAALSQVNAGIAGRAAPSCKAAAAASLVLRVILPLAAVRRYARHAVACRIGRTQQARKVANR